MLYAPHVDVNKQCGKIFVDKNTILLQIAWSPIQMLVHFDGWVVKFQDGEVEIDVHFHSHQTRGQEAGHQFYGGKLIWFLPQLFSFPSLFYFWVTLSGF